MCRWQALALSKQIVSQLCCPDSLTGSFKPSTQYLWYPIPKRGHHYNASAHLSHNLYIVRSEGVSILKTLACWWLAGLHSARWIPRRPHQKCQRWIGVSSSCDYRGEDEDDLTSCVIAKWVKKTSMLTMVLVSRKQGRHRCNVNTKMGHVVLPLLDGSSCIDRFMRFRWLEWTFSMMKERFLDPFWGR